MYKRNDSIVVKTNADTELTVKIVFIPNGRTLDSINEIKDLQPLERVISLVSKQGIFANSKANDGAVAKQSEKNKPLWDDDLLLHFPTESTFGTIDVEESTFPRSLFSIGID